jgi:hypothetical protein
MAAGCRCYLGNSSACYKMGNYRPISMTFGTQTKTDMLILKITQAEVYGHFSRKYSTKTANEQVR